MGFKNLSLRAIILVSIAGVVLLVTLWGVMTHHPQQEADPQANTPIVPAVLEPVQMAAPALTPLDPSTKDAVLEENQSIKEMKEQMDNDRLQQKKIKTLKLELEQTNLQLEKDKALSEIDKLERGNMGVVNDSDDQQGKYPDVKVVYIGGSVEKKQAILAINGTNYWVSENNEPVKNMKIVSITGSTVTVHFNQPQALNAVVEYKPE